MAKEITGKKVATNVTISLLVQVVSLAVGFILNLIVPKFLEIYQYAHWQTYVLYVGYVGVLHFGLLDGIVLRYSQYDFEELDKARIRSQFKILLVSTSIISLIGILVGALVIGNTDGIIVVLVAVGIVTKNLYSYNTFSFQITNRIKIYALVVLVHRLIYGIVVVFLLIFGVQNFIWYCIADIMGDMAACLVSMFFNKGIYLGKGIGFREAFKEYKTNVLTGIILMFANWSSMLLSGGAKMFIQWRFDELIFGNVAFAFSISNFFLTFINAVSIVLFPSLKRLDPNKLPETYTKIQKILTPVLITALTFYFLARWALEIWVPQYTGSLVYIGFILPTIIWSSKVTLLTNNYLKVYRKEKSLLVVNIISVLIAFILFGICAYIMQDIKAVIISLVCVMFFKSTVSELIVYKIIEKKARFEHIVELLMIAIFVVIVTLLSLLDGLLVWLGVLIIYLLSNIKSIKGAIKNETRNVQKS